MDSLAEQVTQYMLVRNLISKNQTEWCHYMLVHRLMSILSFCILVPVGALLVGWLGSISFIASFRFLRARTGGYHAKTPSGCLLASLVVQSGFLLFLPTLNSPGIVLLLLLVAETSILFLAPANNCELHLSIAECKAIRPRILIRVGLTIVCSAVCTLFALPLAGCIALSVVAVALLLVLAQSGYGTQ
ncbi:MAG: accessory gene regulator B family protein [Pygmaiobacter sp.]|nr:accessory gene regulator B family protein [Pygmaiobacter sp.]